MKGVTVGFRNGEKLFIPSATGYETVCDNTLVAVIVGDKQALINLSEICYIGYTDILEEKDK